MSLQEAPVRSARSERTRHRILEAAGRCFVARGYPKTTVEEIAATAGFSKALVYHHFEGKQGVLQAVLERTLDDWYRACGFEELAEAEDTLEAIERMHRVTIDYAREQPLLRALFQLDMLVVIGNRNQVVRDAMERSRAALQRAIERGVETGQLRSDLEPRQVTDVVRILYMSLVDHFLNPEWIDASNESLVDASLDVLFRGIAGEGGR